MHYQHNNLLDVSAFEMPIKSVKDPVILLKDNNGIEKYTTEIVLLNYRGELVLLDRASENNSLQSIESQTEVVKETQNPSKKQNINEIDSLEDDIPF